MPDLIGIFEPATFRILLLILFGLFTVYAGIRSVLVLRKMRARREYKGSILEWMESPTLGWGFSGLRYEGGAWAATVVHGLSVAAAGAAVCLVLFARPLRPPLSWGLAGVFLVPAMTMMVSMAGIGWGTALFNPLAQLLGGARHVAVSPDGILFLGSIFPWSAFNGFSLAVEGSAVRLWSAFFPGLTCLVLAPPPEKMPALLELLRKNLPGGPAEASRSFLVECAFPALMAVVCGPLVLAAWLMVLAPAELALIVDGLLMMLLMFIGGQGLMWIAFRGKMRPAPLEQGSTPGSNGTGAASG